MSALSNATLRAAKPRQSPYKIKDPQTPGLFMVVVPNGRKSWRLRQMVARKTSEKTLGAFPDLPLEHARAMALQMRASAETANFKTAADLWIDQKRMDLDPATVIAIESRLRLHILPELGHKPVAAIKPSEVLAVVEKCRGAKKGDTAARCLAIMRQVFAHACVKYDLTFNPASEVMQARLSRPPVTHRKAPTLGELGLLLQTLDTYSSRTTARGLEFLARTMVRYGEVRYADWSEFSRLADAKRAEWIIPAARMKMRRAHVVPLSRQCLSLLKAQAGIGKSFPTRGLVFPGPDGAPLSENAFLSLIAKKVGKRAYTVHGIRATASTFLNEVGKPFDVIEAALAHTERNGARRAYNRADYLAARRELMQFWSDELDRARDRFALI
jgi:integrase